MLLPSPYLTIGRYLGFSSSNNSLFLDEAFVPYVDQWAFLSSVRRMSRAEVEAVLAAAESRGELRGIRLPITDEAEDQPWTMPPSRRTKPESVTGPHPTQINLVLGNQLYIPKAGATTG